MNFLFLLQTIISIMLVVAILLQARGSGLGSAFGGQAKSYHSRRGFEKVLFKTTLVLAAAFIFLSLLALL